MEVMLDIETMGTGHNGLVVAIGAVRFDWGTAPNSPSTLSPGYRVMDPDHFYVNILIQDGLSHGLQVDGATLRWWLYQSDEARKALFQPVPRSLPDALIAFDTWLNTGGKFRDGEDGAGVWSHATFDFVKVSDAYEVAGLHFPWHHRQARDIRTLNFLAYGPGKPPMTPKGTHAHNALWDAYYQTLDVQNAVQVLAGKQEEMRNLAAIGLAVKTSFGHPAEYPNGTYRDPAQEWAEEVCLRSNGGH